VMQEVFAFGVGLPGHTELMLYCLPLGGRHEIKTRQA